MADNLNKINNNFPSIAQMTQQLGRAKGHQAAAGGGTSFEEVLNGRLADMRGGLKFSKHANERMHSRNIDLSAEQLERLETGVNKAHTKGINESLVMIDDMAFIVNIKNSTVITAVNDMEEQVFTNIDGAVIA